MKAVLFAGGLGTRLSEETTLKPKPMVTVGGKPVLWHIMQSYSNHGVTDFVVLGGYKIESIREFFLNYHRMSGDFTIDMTSGELTWSRPKVEPWTVTVLDTGLDTMTGGRLLRAREIIGDETFCLTYGDGLSDVDITSLIAFHRAQGRSATVTAVTPPGRFGVMQFSDDGDSVRAFREKQAEDVGMINGGYFVCEPSVFDLIPGDDTVWEQEPMRALVQNGQLSAYKHRGFWHPMDTIRDRAALEEEYKNGAPWLNADKD